MAFLPQAREGLLTFEPSRSPARTTLPVVTRSEQLEHLWSKSVHKNPESSNEVTIIALARMVHLLSAELVAGTHRDEFCKLEQAMRARIEQIDIVGLPSETIAEGVTEARNVVEQVLEKVRAQVAALPQSSSAMAEKSSGQYIH